jgi:hypothetical protein
VIAPDLEESTEPLIVIHLLRQTESEGLSRMDVILPAGRGATGSRRRSDAVLLRLAFPSFQQSLAVE